MIETITTFIDANSGLVALAFVLTNAAWLIFTFFYKFKKQKELESARHERSLDLEQRRRFYESRIERYEKYAGMLDDFGRKYQTELFSRMAPAFEKYLKRSLEGGDQRESAEAISDFASEVGVIMNEAQAEYLKIKAESKALKLLASDELINCLDHLEVLVEKSMNMSNSFIQELPLLMTKNDQAAINARQKAFAGQSSEISAASERLEKQMRLDLRAI